MIVLVDGPEMSDDEVRVGLKIGVVSGVDEGKGSWPVLVGVNFGIVEVEMISCVEIDTVAKFGSETSVEDWFEGAETRVVVEVFPEENVDDPVIFLG
jgi:hypothetical protein